MRFLIWKREKEEHPDIAQHLTALAVELETHQNLEVALVRAAESLDEKAKPSGKKLFRFLLSSTPLSEHQLVEEPDNPSVIRRAWCLLQRSTKMREGENRHLTLNQAVGMVLNDLCESTKKFVGKTHLKILLLYGIGVLTPLILAGLIPAWTLIGGSANTLYIAITYCGILPVLVFWLINRILAERPPLIQPPQIPLPPLTLKMVGFALPSLGILVAARIGGLEGFPLVFAGLWAAVLAVGIVLIIWVKEPYLRRKRAEEAESELPDALLEIGSMLKEGLPIEEVLNKTAKTRSGHELGKMVRRIHATRLMGGDIDQSPAGDSVVSERAWRHLQMVIRLAKRSSEAAGGCIIRIAHHLKRLEEIKQEIKLALQELTSSMRSAALFFAPLVIAITARMHEIIEKHGDGFLTSTTSGSAGVVAAFGAYSVILSGLLLYFAVGLELGDDRIVKRLAVGIGCIIALAVFTLSWMAGGVLLTFLAV